MERVPQNPEIGRRFLAPVSLPTQAAGRTRAAEREDEWVEAPGPQGTCSIPLKLKVLQGQQLDIGEHRPLAPAPHIPQTTRPGQTNHTPTCNLSSGRGRCGLFRSRAQTTQHAAPFPTLHVLAVWP